MNNPIPREIKTVCILSCLLGLEDSHIQFFADVISSQGYPLRLICPGTVPETLTGRDITHFALPTPTRHFEAGSSAVNITSGLWQRLRNSITAYRQLLKTKPDIVLCTQPDSWWIAICAKRKLHNKVVVNLLEIYEDRASAFPKFLRPVIRKILRSTLRSLARSTDEVIHVSRARQAHYNYLEKPGEIISFFPRLADLKLGLVKKMGNLVTIVQAGGLTWSYGADQLLEAIPLAKAKCPETHFLVIGRTRSELKNLSLLKKLVEEGTLEIIENVPHAEVLQIMQKCDIGINLVLPLGQTYLLAMPRKFFEYLAVGIPVVAADMPTLREVIDLHECGVLVDPESPQSIAEGIIKLAADDGLRRRMGSSGRLAAEKCYNGEIESRKISALFARLSGRGETTRVNQP